MEQVELDIALEELEVRLERLRGLYEQYFLGLEKIEPAVARKDVDRRIYLLRREKIRNTAKRFKLQTIIQRYNTFQQYWQRICREIENGTYKRHLLRAQKNGGELLTIAARRRLGRAARTSQRPAAASPSQPPSAAAGAPEAALPAPQPRATAPAAPAGPLGSPPPPARRPPLPVAPKPSAPFESLDLDMDFMGDWDPTARRAAGPAKPASPAAAKPALVPKPATLPQPAVPAVSAPKPQPAPAAAPPRSLPAPRPAPPPPAAPVASASQPRVPPARPIAPPRTAPAARPAAPSPPPALRAAPPPKPAPAARPAPAASVDDARLRELHTRLQQAKQQTKEGNVSFEGLAKSIRAAEAKLRAQHNNRKIDFDVVIKDGRAVVKPIVR